MYSVGGTRHIGLKAGVPAIDMSLLSTVCFGIIAVVIYVGILRSDFESFRVKIFVRFIIEKKKQILEEGYD